MSLDDMVAELEELRRFKLEVESKRFTKAFMRLEDLLDSGYDPLMSRSAFRTIADCLLGLRDEVIKK